MQTDPKKQKIQYLIEQIQSPDKAIEILEAILKL